MAKTFEGRVSVVLNTKGEIALRKDAEGRFSAANAAELYETLMRLSKARKTPVNKYSLFIADQKGEPVLLVNRYGNPYLALLPKRQDGAPKVRSVTKLA